MTVGKIGIPTGQIELNEGKKLYILNCVRCHNADPSIKGKIGPDLLTTPANVFESKVLLGVYPSGYSPKRRTKIMPKFKSLEGKTDKLYKYIQSFKKKD